MQQQYDLVTCVLLFETLAAPKKRDAPGQFPGGGGERLNTPLPVIILHFEFNSGITLHRVYILLTDD